MKLKNFAATCFALVCGCLFNSNVLFSQVPCRYFNQDSIPESTYAYLRNEFARNKQIPRSVEKPVLIALSYFPELKDTRIKFRIKKRHTPLQTRATWAGLFKVQSIREYVITISDNTEPLLVPLLLKNVPFNAQIGAAGHELSHVADFSRYSFLRLLWHGIKNISPGYLDKFEFRTDSVCIAHGLGYQLLAWSENVRKKMNTKNWRGPDYSHKPQNTERYMNPETIRKKMKENPLYSIS